MELLMCTMPRMSPEIWLLDQLANALLSRGYATVAVDDATSSAIDETFREATRFFTTGDAAKARASTPAKLEGYRPLGAEYSASADRVDLNESFAVWLRNSSDPDVRKWADEMPLHRSMTSLLHPLCALANATLATLRERLNPTGQQYQASDISYLQLNHYQPSAHGREVLMDPHEDGHLITIAASTAPGLEVWDQGRFQPVLLAPGEVILWAGSILTAVSGGLIQPLVHRVVKVEGINHRLSAQFFVNASLEAEQRPWIENESNSDVDIRALTILKSESFGLRAVDKAFS